jgi:hypothetical protein
MLPAILLEPFLMLPAILLQPGLILFYPVRAWPNDAAILLEPALMMLLSC